MNVCPYKRGCTLLANVCISTPTWDQVSLPGPYRLTVQLFRENYAAVDEVCYHGISQLSAISYTYASTYASELNHNAQVHYDKASPVIHFDQLPGSATWLHFASPTALSDSLSPGPSAFQPASVGGASRGAVLPPCASGRNAEVKGRWVSLKALQNGTRVAASTAAATSRHRIPASNKTRAERARRWSGLTGEAYKDLFLEKELVACPRARTRCVCVCVFSVCAARHRRKTECIQMGLRPSCRTCTC